MPAPKPIHPDFLFHLEWKTQPLIELFHDLRAYLLDLHPDANELVYHTHALTTVFSLSEKLGDAWCMIPIYTNHLHLGFTKGTLLPDPHKLLAGTGNLIRHIPINQPADYRNYPVKTLLLDAHSQAMRDFGKPQKSKGLTFSKIKTK